MFYLLLNKYAAFGKPQAVISDEPDSNEQADGVGVGGSIQLSNHESSSSRVIKSGIIALLYLYQCVFVYKPFCTILNLIDMQRFKMILEEAPHPSHHL